MKAIQSKEVQNVLRKRFGLIPLAQGNATGHEIWVDRYGRSCRPVLRKKDVPYAVLYSLSLELEAKGICTRRNFLCAVKGD